MNLSRIIRHIMYDVTLAYLRSPSSTLIQNPCQLKRRKQCRRSISVPISLRVLWATRFATGLFAAISVRSISASIPVAAARFARRALRLPFAWTRRTGLLLSVLDSLRSTLTDPFGPPLSDILNRLLQCNIGACVDTTSWRSWLRLPQQQEHRLPQPPGSSLVRQIESFSKSGRRLALTHILLHPTLPAPFLPLVTPVDARLTRPLRLRPYVCRNKSTF